MKIAFHLMVCPLEKRHFAIPFAFLHVCSFVFSRCFFFFIISKYSLPTVHICVMHICVYDRLWWWCHSKFYFKGWKSNGALGSWAKPFWVAVKPICAHMSADLHQFVYVALKHESNSPPNHYLNTWALVGF